MRYECHVSAYDMLDRVAVAATVWDTQRPGSGYSDPDMMVATVFVGEGVSDPREWLRDALCTLIERI